MKLTKRIALIISVLAIALLSAVPAFAAEDMGTPEVVKTMPDGFDSAIEIKAIDYVETNNGKKNETAAIPYAYVKPAKDGTQAFIKYTFKVDKAGMYDIAFAIKAKVGDGFREGVFVIDEKYRYEVSLKHDEGDIVEYSFGYALAEFEAGEHTIILTPSERYDNENFEAVQLHKILVKYEGEAPAAEAAPKTEAAVTAPKTADAITMLVFAAAGAALVISKKRG